MIFSNAVCYKLNNVVTLQLNNIGPSDCIRIRSKETCGNYILLYKCFLIRPSFDGSFFFFFFVICKSPLFVCIEMLFKHKIERNVGINNPNTFEMGD